MTRLRFSLALASVFAFVSGASAQVVQTPKIDQKFDQEVTERTAEILKYCDADGDGLLKYPETTKAVSQVVEAMVDRLPPADRISGGEVMIRRMRKTISQQSIDRNADHEVDPVELGIFIGFAIAQSEKTLRTPYNAQYAITMEETADQVMRYTWALERERRIRDNYKWQSIAAQQRKEFYFELHARKRAQWARDQLEIARARERADRDALLRENSPGVVPTEATKPAPPAEQP